MARRPAAFVRIALSLAALAACDRHTEAFDPAEQPREPDLSRIFPAGAQGEGVQAGQPLELPPPPAVRDAESSAAESGAPIRGTLRVAAEHEGRLPSGAVLFLIARRGSAGPPLAVKRIDAPRFPLDFEIGPDDRMIASIPFSGPVQLTARLDSDGNATSRTPGDLQGSAPEPVEPGAAGVEITLSEKL
jgi:hypothetical protein